MSQKHSALPWVCGEKPHWGQPGIDLFAADGLPIANVVLHSHSTSESREFPVYLEFERNGTWVPEGESERLYGTAEFIVRAVNSHYDLLEALQGLLTLTYQTQEYKTGDVGAGNLCKKAEAAIAKATKGKDRKGGGSCA